MFKLSAVLAHFDSAVKAQAIPRQLIERTCLMDVTVAASMVHPSYAATIFLLVLAGMLDIHTVVT